MRTLRDLLRDGTGPVHARLERRLALDRADLTLDAYRAVLAAFRGWYGPLEAALRRAPQVSPTADRTGWLDADLARLGLPGEAAALPECGALPVLAGASEVFGCGYVIEGASLGGVVLARLLRARFGEDVTVRFFTGHAQETGARWRAFVERLETARPTLDAERVLAAAIGTFTSLEGWLDQRGVLTAG